MLVYVTCAGIVIGTAEFEPASGLAHAPLEPTPAYAFVAGAAQAVGRTLSDARLWSAVKGDFADAAAAEWSGERLALEDLLGRELGVNNLVVVEFPCEVGGAAIRVVADFRPDLARVEAFLETLGPGGGRTRPAA